ncbi:OLC1v1010393C1 [Oldenlandia corymbosa var. corymbosa]|uniref:OLC1v1010393C1 n=1 Tax=Oldenlandia corymbosa var. corymbosa TaxID=529605 RepID=A0AAV1DU91_OLDCO|nr:OLC1v1010393C1 [Oldenlandia corymbosa var. corymbosa]
MHTSSSSVLHSLYVCPTVIVESTPQTISALQCYLSNPNPKDSHTSILEDFSAIAFTSRTGIIAFTEALTSSNIQTTTPLAPHGEPFTVSALGKDSELLNESFIHKLCQNPSRIQVVVPPIATPSSLVDALGSGHGRKVLCPVPSVLGLNEPPVVPKFLSDLDKMGWIAVRVNGYETRWAGPKCAEELVKKTEEECGVDALVFTSTAEVEGLLGLNWDMMRRRCPTMLVAAHGPVTASGAERLGVGIDVISSRFGSFDGIVDALAYRWKSLDFC